MRFPFKNFWRIIPYGFYGLLLYESSSTYMIVLALALIVSLYKSDAKHPLKNTLLSILEVLLLFWISRDQRNLLPLFYVVPLVDWGWQQVWPSKIQWPLLGIFSLLLLFLSGNYILGVMVIASTYWVGCSLYEMEDKKLKAQAYYDRLRISEEALRKANLELEAYYATLEEVTVLRERTRISRDIHDNVGHALSTTLIQLQAIELRLEKEAPSQTVYVQKLIAFISGALENTREIVHKMGADAQSKRHLKHELAELCQTFSDLTQVLVTLTYPEHDNDISYAHKEVLFRTVQESLTNAVKHGSATRIKVVLTRSGDRLLLTIQDNGIGAQGDFKGFGLSAMRERVEKIGGELHLSSEQNNGFTVKASLPGVSL